jgi:hypothetical protein
VSDTPEFDEIACIANATVQKVQTLSSGGFRITIDGINPELPEAAKLMQYADQPGALFYIPFLMARDKDDRDKLRKSYI